MVVEEGNSIVACKEASNLSNQSECINKLHRFEEKKKREEKNC
jgi:hypothetical protein